MRSARSSMDTVANPSAIAAFMYPVCTIDGFST
jgi:hypothetical protein